MTRFIEQVTLDRESFDLLKGKFVVLGSSTEESWELIMPQHQTSSSDTLFSGERKTNTELKNLLQEDRFKETLGKGDLPWAHRALDHPLNPQPKTLLQLAQVTYN